MKKKDETAALKQTIALLKIREEQELQSLKEQFNLSFESLKPVNLIRHSLKQVIATPGFKSTLVKASVGLATGYLSNKVLFSAAQRPVKKVLGIILELGIAGLITKRGTKEKEQVAVR